RLQGDWSSDVCSSDLAARLQTDLATLAFSAIFAMALARPIANPKIGNFRTLAAAVLAILVGYAALQCAPLGVDSPLANAAWRGQIGRASWRGRSGGGG